MTARRRATHLVAAVLLGVVLAGCELRTEVNVDVADDGSGTVEVGAGLDDDALDRRPGVLEELAIDDLLRSGWTASEPTREDDGLTWVRLRHDFGRPEEVGPLVEEIAGPDGPFRDFELRRSDEFAETTYAFSGVVDFSTGAAGLTDDPELSEALDAEVAQLVDDRIGRALDEVLSVQVGIRLPGEVSSNAPTTASNGAVWRPSVVDHEAVELEATGTVRRTERYVWLGVAAAAGLALALFLLIRLAAWRRGRAADPATP